MARLIDADLPMEQMEKLLDHHLMMGNFSADGAVSDCIEFLKTAPTINAEPVRNGRWIRAKDKPPEDPEELVLCIVSGKAGGVTFKNAIQIGRYDPEEGWTIEGWEAYKNLVVSYWMHQPEFPHEEMEDEP